ncbi:testis-expressed protein 36 [Sebastes umbrosus]|uniref:testis-expressed protein 36 n=1 Tax=Sebastes umbrosus TaxID=72105 RepID=UPI00189EAC04|nr:testis-expressed protein 36 [Sebastes umbrosus]
MSNDGKWFAHPVSPENETRSREACTSNGIMLTQVQSALPQALNVERYPKWKTQQKSREYPFSDHDNKHALKDNVSVFTHGVGRRKSPDDHRQHNSHFCMCHDGDRSSPVENGGNITVHQTDFTVKQAVNIPTSNRKFPRNHKQKSAEAALAQKAPFKDDDFAGSVGYAETKVTRKSKDALCHLCCVIYGRRCCVNEWRVHNYSAAETGAKKGRIWIACFKHDIKAQLQLLRSAPVA